MKYGTGTGRVGRLEETGHRCPSGKSSDPGVRALKSVLRGTKVGLVAVNRVSQKRMPKPSLSYLGSFAGVL